MSSIRIVIALVFAIASAALPAFAQDTRNVDLRFPRWTSGTTITDTITGYESVNYRVGVSAGQRMSVHLDTDNSSNYFNITAPGASEALFVGSMSGNSTTFRVPSSGNYVINVYLMRNAARRDETADYALTLYVEGQAAAAPPVQRPQPDFADGLAGGPDFWQVTGLSGGDTLNVRASSSTSARILGTLGNGDTVRNLGCTMNGSTRWCQIERRDGLSGWVAGRYLHESFGETAQPSRPQPVSPPPNATPSRIDTSLMPRFCQGEASAQYGVRPQALTTNAAFQSGNNYVVQGYFDRDGSTTFFNCWFGLDGSFAYIN